MPTYEYECRSCGHRFEQFQQMSDAPVKKCPECGKRKVERLLSAFAGVHVKGGSSASDSPCARAGTCPSAGSCPMQRDL